MNILAQMDWLSNTKQNCLFTDPLCFSYVVCYVDKLQILVVHCSRNLLFSTGEKRLLKQLLHAR